VNIAGTAEAARVEMLRLATRDIPRAGVWTDEIDRAGDNAAAGAKVVSYTIDTLERLSTLFPGARARLLIGADQAAAFHLWRRFRDVIAAAEPVVACRGEYATHGALIATMRGAGVWSNQELQAWEARMMPPVLIDSSSTRLRELLAQGSLSEEERTYIERGTDPRVLRFVRAKGLYAR